MDSEKQITKQQAIDLVASKFWEGMTHREIAEFQLHTDRLCMPWNVFHEAVEKALSRGVFTHEFASPDHLRAEIRGDKPAPTFDEILSLIPKDKQIIIVKEEVQT